MLTQDPWLLLQVLGVGECALAGYFLLSCFKNSGRIRSLFRSVPLFLTAWLVLAAGVCVTLGSSQALVGSGIAGGVVAALCHPAFGVAFLIANLLMRPWEVLPNGNLLEILPRGLAGICVLSLLLEQLRRRSSSLIIDKPLVVFWALAAWICTSAALASNSSDSIAYATAALLPAAVVMFATRNGVTEKWSIQVCTNALVLGVLTMAVCALIDTGSKKFLFDAGVRLESFGQWGNSNDLAALFATAIPIVVVRTFFIGGIFRRVILGFFPVAVLGLSLLLTQSRGGLLALLACAIPFLYDRRKQPALLLSVGAAAAILLVISSLVFSRESGELEGSKDSRLNYMVVGLKMVKGNPLLGVGPGNYPILYERYTTEFGEYGFRTAHSTWVLILAEAGIPALLLFGAIFWFSLKGVIRGRGEFSELLMAFIAYFVAVSFLSQSYALATYFILAIGLVAGAVSPTLKSIHQDGYG